MSVTEAAQRRVGLSKFARNCQPDALLEIPEEMQKERYCFPAKGKLTGAQGCEAQTRLPTPSRACRRIWRNALSPVRSTAFYFCRSKSSLSSSLLLSPFAWRSGATQWMYTTSSWCRRLSAAIIGAFAMLFGRGGLRLSANQQCALRPMGRGTTVPFSLVIVPWALLLLFYFLRRLRKNLEIVGQLAGVVASAIAILRYEEINDWSVRLFGAGADNATIGLLLGIAALGFVQLWWPFRMPVPRGREPQAAKAPTAAGSAPRAQPGAGAAAKLGGAPTGAGPAASTAAAGQAVAARAAGPGAASSPSTQVRPAAMATRPAAAATANPNSTAALPPAPAKHGPDR